MKIKSLTTLVFLFIFNQLLFAEYIPVSWDSLKQVSIDISNILTSTSDGGPSWDAGASSQEVLPAYRNGTVEMVATNNNTNRMLGLSHVDLTAHYSTIETSIYLRSNGKWRCRLPDATSFQVGDYEVDDTFCIEVKRCSGADTINYIQKRGGATIYEYKYAFDSAHVNTSYVVDVSLFNIGASVSNVMVEGFEIPIPDLPDFVYNDPNAYKNNTLRLQYLIDTLAVLQLDNPCGNSTLYINRVSINRDIEIDGNGLIIKKSILIWGDAEENEVNNLNELKWHRFFSLNHRGSSNLPNLSRHDINLANGDLASNFEMRNLTLDGSILDLEEEYGDVIAFRNWEIEQSSLLFLSGGLNYHEANGRVNVVIDNCHFKNNGGDGITCYKHVDIDITNSDASDCFRGGFTCNGGYSIIDITNFNTYGEQIPTGIDFESSEDGAGGPDSTLQIIVNITNMTLDSDLDIGISDDSYFHATNVTLEKPTFKLYARESEVYFDGCDFVNDILKKPTRGVHGSIIRSYGDLTFNNCNFKALFSDSTINGITSAVPLIVDNGHENQIMQFFNCNFSLDPGSNNVAEAMVIGLPIGVSNIDNGNKILLSGCTFSDDLTNGIHSYQYRPTGCADANARGGVVSIIDCEFNCDLPVRFDGTDEFPFVLSIVCSEFYGSKFINLKTNGGDYMDFISFQNVLLEQSANKIIAAQDNPTHHSNNIDDFLTVQGSRIIKGLENPNVIDANGFVGDLFIENNNVWECTTSGYYYGVAADVNDCERVNLDNLSQKSSTWVLTDSSAGFILNLNALLCGDGSRASETTAVLEENPVVEETALELYPNPVHNQLVIRSTQNISAISIYDVNGRLIHTEELFTLQRSFEYETSNLVDGFYFIVVNTGGEQQLKKFVKYN